MQSQVSGAQVPHLPPVLVPLGDWGSLDASLALCVPLNSIHGPPGDMGQRCILRKLSVVFLSVAWNCHLGNSIGVFGLHKMTWSKATWRSTWAYKYLGHPSRPDSRLPFCPSPLSWSQQCPNPWEQGTGSFRAGSPPSVHSLSF